MPIHRGLCAQERCGGGTETGSVLTKVVFISHALLHKDAEVLR